MFGRTDFLEINISPLNVRIDQLHPDPFADIQALEPLHQLAFDWHTEKPNPRPFLGSACDNPIKLLSNP